jgi:TRAP-type C4-dicarboxylate transport system substrate-binding protein
MIRSRRAIACLVLAALLPLAGLSAQTVTLRMAANVPANSPWDLGLKRLASEFARVSGGRVKLVFPQTAHVSSEMDTIQKMRLGVDGALFTTYGMALLDTDIFALSLPTLIRSDEEFDAVLGAVTPLIKSRLEDRYVILAIAKGGWLRFFSRTPIVYPEDIEKTRISIDPSDTKVVKLMQSMGARVIQGSTADFLLQVNSNAVDATCASPIYIASLWSQLRGKVAYMSGYRVSPFIGAVVFNKSSWDKVPADLRPQLEKVVQDIAGQISLDTAKLESDAIASLDGIKALPPPADSTEKWARALEQRRKGVIADMFSAEMLETMDAALAKVRKSK